MKYTQTVKRLVLVDKVESIEVPIELLKLVKSNDKEWGWNGTHWMGCERGRDNVIQRLQSYMYDYKYDLQHEYLGRIFRYPVKLTSEYAGSFISVNKEPAIA